MKKHTGLKAAAAAIIGLPVLGFAVFERKAVRRIYRGSMVRNEKKAQDTIRITGVDWMQYEEVMRSRLRDLESWERENPVITASDGLKLSAAYFPPESGKRVVIGFHGYTSDGITNHLGVSGFFRRAGFGMLFPDARAHGKSEGTYVGFGSPDRTDAHYWIRWVTDRMGEDVEIWLYGQSMGATTVLLAGAMGLPAQVKGIISDSAFASGKQVFTHVIRNIRHLPPRMIVHDLNKMSKKNAGFGIDDSDALKEVSRIRVPVLFLHGSDDPFVPTEMCAMLYDRCTAPKEMVIIEGAKHIEGYYKDTERYEKALADFIAGC